ncbi:helix-turn-helix transcriptional regulator [Breoghania sp.]|uniref:helix-turn-helix transcriptional regulator n=1 Tax=Breoghania sp. TaxID=2065378 RepID=UPI0026139BD8|nr:helix-turn-helix transcriptional regulator [Breoghania sp.]MDJ0933168.1 helix-turn-helix transcriptional regulator [Breoghania sp.]
MDGISDLFDITRKLNRATDPGLVLDGLESQLRQYGATHILITGLPMPNRPIDHLVLRMNWSDKRRDGAELTSIQPSDNVLLASLTAIRPFIWKSGADDTAHSELLEAADAGRGDINVLLVPVDEIDPFQATIICAGPNLELSPQQLSGLSMLATVTFRRLIQLGVVSTDRPGDLSARERRVLELTALGKTAADIAELLKISQRTVHAHLQNAGSKLNASNKTHTVVEALRYAQIRL